MLVERVHSIAEEKNGGSRMFASTLTINTTDSNECGLYMAHGKYTQGLAWHPLALVNARLDSRIIVA